jgi:beta-phosphoglucomutase-like phosphatase (HAD superfamily)
MRLYIYDLDGTVIDSSHRRRFNTNGDLRLSYWKSHNTRKDIFGDSLLPLAKHMKKKMIGNIVLVCTARNISQDDLDFLENNGLRYDHIISRPKGVNTADHILKYYQLKKFLKDNPHLQDRRKIMYDDSMENLQEISKLKIEGRLAWI